MGGADLNKQTNKGSISEFAQPNIFVPPKRRTKAQTVFTAILTVLSVITVISGFILIFMLLTLELKTDVPPIEAKIPPLSASSRLMCDSSASSLETPQWLLFEETAVEKEPVLYNFANPVPECEPVEYDYFSDTVFIGDSRTQGLIMYTDITPINFAAQGGNIRSIQTKKYIMLKNEDGKNENYTLFEALEKKNGNYKAIYISTGVNELGWSESAFIEKYAALIDSIREITDVPIYIQLIMPVTNEYAETSLLRNETAVSFNESLRILASEKAVFLLDPTFIHTLEDGSLDPEHSYDGAHLWPKSYAELAEYYRTHVVDIYSYDNTIPPPNEPDADDEATDSTDISE